MFRAFHLRLRGIAELIGTGTACPIGFPGLLNTSHKASTQARPWFIVLCRRHNRGYIHLAAVLPSYVIIHLYSLHPWHTFLHPMALLSHILVLFEHGYVCFPASIGVRWYDGFNIFLEAIGRTVKTLTCIWICHIVFTFRWALNVLALPLHFGDVITAPYVGPSVPGLHHPVRSARERSWWLFQWCQ